MSVDCGVKKRIYVKADGINWAGERGPGEMMVACRGEGARRDGGRGERESVKIEKGPVERAQVKPDFKDRRHDWQRHTRVGEYRVRRGGGE